MIICQGCGHAFEAPEGYTRSKIQCPACGVICAAVASTARVPARETARQTAREPASAPAAPAPTQAEEPAWPEEEPIPLEVDDSATATPAIPLRQRPTADTLFPCRRCGRRIRRQRECPVCDAAPEPEVLPEEPVPVRVGLAPHSLELDEPVAAPNPVEEEDSPYVLADRLLPRCPKCHKDMAEGAILCTSCGFDLRTRKKVGRNFEPLTRSWETNATLGRRLMWFGVAQGVHLFLALLSSSQGLGFWPFVYSWPLLTGMLAFVLGTYDRIELLRDVRGRVKVTKIWRFCFIPLTPVTTEVRGFEGVTVGQWHDAGLLEWFVFLSLFPLGIIPAIVWWYNAIHTDYFHVALARDHGRAEVYVYRGRSQEQMSEIAQVLCEASGLRNIT